MLLSDARSRAGFDRVCGHQHGHQRLFGHVPPARPDGSGARSSGPGHGLNTPAKHGAILVFGQRPNTAWSGEVSLSSGDDDSASCSAGFPKSCL